MVAKVHHALQTRGALLLRLECLGEACRLPEFDGVAVYQCSGTTSGFLVIVADDLDAFQEMTVVADNVGVIAAHRTIP